MALSANCIDQNVPTERLGKLRNFKTVHMGVELCHEDRSWIEQRRKETRKEEGERVREEPTRLKARGFRSLILWSTIRYS